MRSVFWDDHQAGLDDPEYARAFAAESIRVSTIDTIMNTLTEQVEASGLSKTALARAIGANPAAVRRLLTAQDVNPTLGTLAELAGALGMKVTLAPMTAGERRAITEPMTTPGATRRATTGPRTTTGHRVKDDRRAGKDATVVGA